MILITLFKSDRKVTFGFLKLAILFQILRFVFTRRELPFRLIRSCGISTTPQDFF